MRVLYLCHRVPYPPDKGEKIRAFHQLRSISARHEVDLFTLADRQEDLAHEAALLPYCRSVKIARIIPALTRLRSLPYLVTRTPLTLPCFFSRELQTSVSRALSTHGAYDRIFIYSSAMAQYAVHVSDIPRIIDLVDVDSDKWRQYAAVPGIPKWRAYIYRREANRLGDYERTICAQADRVLVSTDREARVLRETTGREDVHVVPNGVDTDFFDPARFDRGVVSETPGIPTVTFTGDMSYLPNEQAVIFFVHKILPGVRRFLPKVRFVIVGRNPTADVLRLREVEGVEVTGWVPDVRPYLASSHVSVAPFTVASGIQNKILEALAFRLPVVATSRVANGLSPTVAEIVRTADGPEEFASSVVQVLSDRELAARIGGEGRRRVTAEYGWDRSLERLLALVEGPSLPFKTPRASNGSRPSVAMPLVKQL